MISPPVPRITLGYRSGHRFAPPIAAAGQARSGDEGVWGLCAYCAALGGHLGALEERERCSASPPPLQRTEALRRAPARYGAESPDALTGESRGMPRHGRA